MWSGMLPGAGGASGAGAGPEDEQSREMERKGVTMRPQLPPQTPSTSAGP